MNTYVLTPAAGKRLIAKAMTRHPVVDSALDSGTVVLVAGTTNGYIAEEILAQLGQSEGFSAKGFMRGVTVPPGYETTEMGRPPEKTPFPGDVVIVKGQWEPGKTIFDVADTLTEQDVVLKGANALDLTHRRAAVLIGHPQGGTILAAVEAHIGRRVPLLLPVGLEKRVPSDLDALAALVNRPDGQGPRLFPVPGEVFTEIEAIALLTGATAHCIAAGGIWGAEGSVWLAVSGKPEQEQAARELLDEVSTEPPFSR